MKDSNSTGIERIRILSRPVSPVPTEISEHLLALKEIRAVIFDVYGTLFVSASGDIGTSRGSASSSPFGEALALTGFIPPKHPRNIPEIGDAARDLYFAAIRKHHERLRREGIDFPEVDIREVWKETIEGLTRSKIIGPAESTSDRIEALAVEAECRLNPVWPMPGLVRILEYANSRGYLLGIVSNAQFYTPLLFPALTEKDLTALGFAEDLRVWSYRLNTAKPSLRIFGALLGTLRSAYGIEPQETVYIGNDMLNDMYTAHTAGMRTVLFAGDARSLKMRTDDPRCSDVRPDRTVTGLEQLTVLL
jgi:putative hydrolase of the HAD superfamily